MEDTRTLNGLLEFGRIAKNEAVISRFDFYDEGEWPQTTSKTEEATPTTDSN